MNNTYPRETALIISISGKPIDEPDNRPNYQQQLALFTILISTCLERLAFYSLVINLIITLQLSELDWDPTNSVTVSFIFSGTSYVSTLVFAVVSDAKLGRAKTIIIGFVLYLMGYIVVTLISNTHTHELVCGNAYKSNGSSSTTSIANEHCAGPVLGTLVFTAIGVGAVQANMAVFGADQVQERDKPSRYFDKYIIAVNTGGLFATLLIPYVQVIQSDPNRFFYGYVISGSLLFLAVMLFVGSYKYYRHIKPHDSIITKCIPVTLNALHLWQNHKRIKHEKADSSKNVSTDRLDESITSRSSQLENITQTSHSFLDYARAPIGKFSDRVVGDVKSLRRVIFVFLLLIPYWLAYYQIQTTFFLQGERMYIPYISNVTQTKMPVIWMSVGDQLSIIVGIIMINLFVYKYITSCNQLNIILTKFIIAMILSSITMFIAGSIENVRQKQCQPGKTNSDLSILVQLAQYATMGLSEVFGMVASFEFAYLAAPRSAESLIMSLRFCSLGISSFICDAYVKVMTITIKKFDFDCRNSKSILYIYFYVLGGTQLLTLIVFIFCHHKFNILKLNPHKINKKQFM